MSDWNYLVPRYFGSAWHRQRQSTLSSADMEWPRVGIYCPHDPVPWLIGSFEVSPGILEDRGEIGWTWRADFVTGDGYLIRLRRQSGDQAFQSIVDDAPHDRDELNDRLRGIDPFSAAAADVLADMEHADATMRTRVAMKCGTCRLSRTFRLERLQPLLETYWKAGIREDTLESFARRVDRMPSV